MSLKTASQSSQSIEVRDRGKMSVLLRENEDLLKNVTYWHKFDIEDVHGLERDQVFKIILEHVQPLDFIPLAYSKKENGLGAFFFARLCGPVMMKIIFEDNFTVPNSYYNAKPFKLSLVLRYTTTKEVKVDLFKNVIKVLGKRFKKDKAYVQLDNFEKDPDLLEYCSLSQPKMMAFILHLVKTLNPVVSLKLNNNGIKSLEPLKILKGLNLKYIDLRNNAITDLTELNVLKDYQIREVWLDGNPVCAIYDDYNYIQRVLDCCPNMEKLDGFILRQNGFPSFRRNLLCSIKSYDMVKTFLEEYFTCYDCKDYTKMELLYGKEALFSFTVKFKNQSDGCYQNYSRNLLAQSKSQDCFDVNLENLWHGSKDIINLFNRLPQIEHDPNSFTVDVSYYSKTHAVIVVTGVFREVPVIPPINKLITFSRSFVLQLNSNQHFLIINEQLHISDVKTSLLATGFKVNHVLSEPKTSKQINELVYAMGLVSNLTHEWCKRFLEECQYDLKQSLILITHLIDKIPSSAFVDEPEKP